jgi:RHS repeat-associated protein
LVLAALMVGVPHAPANDESGIATADIPGACWESDLKALLQACIARNKTNPPPGNPGPFTRGYKEIAILMGQCFSGGFTNLVCLGDNVIVGASADPQKTAHAGLRHREGFTPKEVMIWFDFLNEVILQNTNAPLKDILDFVRSRNPDTPAMTPPPVFSPGGGGIVLGDARNVLQPSNSFHAVVFGGYSDVAGKGPGEATKVQWQLYLGSVNATKDFRATLQYFLNFPAANIQVKSSGTYAQLGAMITNAWAKMNDNEQFVLFIADHGTRRCTSTNVVPCPAGGGYSVNFTSEPFLKGPDVMRPTVEVNTSFVGEPGEVRFNQQTIGMLPTGEAPMSHEFVLQPNLIKPVGENNLVEVVVPNCNAGVQSMALSTGPVLGNAFPAEAEPNAAVINVCNATGTNKTDFHAFYDGQLSSGVTIRARRTQADGTPIADWAVSGTTINYDPMDGVTEVSWVDLANPIPHGGYASFSVVESNRPLNSLHYKWSPASPNPTDDWVPVNLKSIRSVTASNLELAILSAPLLVYTQLLDVSVAFANNRIPASQFYFSDPAVTSLPNSPTQTMVLDPETSQTVTVTLPGLPPDAPLPTAVVCSWERWTDGGPRNTDTRITQIPMLNGIETTCVTNCPGENSSFMLDLPGGGFRWYKDGLPISGATGSTLVLSNLTGIEGGVYTGIATNATEIKRRFFKLFIADNVPPTINCPSNLVVAATGSSGAVVNYTVTATDVCGVVSNIVCNPPSGSLFPIGTTVVNCIARDTFQNSATCSFTVTVVEAANVRVNSFSFTPAINRVGSSSSASISGSNNGSVPANDVTATISVDPPNSASLQNMTFSGGSITTLSPSAFRWNIGNLSTGQTFFIAVSLSAAITGTYTTAVSLATSSLQSSTSDDTQFAKVMFLPPAPGSFIPGAQTSTKEPVSTFSGKEVFTEPPDLNLGGPLPVFFQRHYDGALAEDGVVNSALGPNWQHNYDIALSVNGTNATVGFRLGRILRFQNDGANWNLIERTDIPFRLLQNGPDFILGDPRSQFMYFFNAGGLLTRIEDGRGNTNFLAYNGTLLTNVNDGLNRQLTLHYDGSGQLTNVSDGVRSVQLHHSSPLASAVDALGLVTSYSYTTNTNNPALLTARTLPEGNTPYSQNYNPEGRVNSQTDGAGNTTTFGYGPAFNGRQTTITNPLGHVTTHLYTANGEFSRFTDEAGRNVLLGQDGAGRRNSVRDRLNNVTSITYSATNGFPTLINLPSNPDESFAYSPRVVNGFTFFDLTRATHPDGTTNLYGYDAMGNLISHTNRNGDVWRYGRNARGQLLSITNPLGGTAAFTYDANARLVSAMDSDVGATTYEYDALNRLTKLTHPNPSTVQFGYDALDRLTSLTDERTNTTTFLYDGNSRLTNVVNALNQSSRFEYDAVDRLVRSVDRLGQSVGLGYDPRNLLSFVTNRNGFVTRLDYDSRQRLTGVVNPANVTNRLDYDDEGLLTAAINPLGETIRWQRDAMGYVTNVIDPLSNRFSLALDAMKRVTGVTNPLGQKALFAYDRRGLLTNATRELGIAATYRYSPLGLLTNIVDPKSSPWNFAYTSVGRMTNFSDPLARATRYQYDTRGRLVRTIYPDNVTLTNTYDGANNLTRSQYSDGTDLQFAYDPLNRLTNATGSDPIEFNYDAMDRVTNTRQVGLDFGATYDPDGRLTSVTYSNGLFTVTYSYDSRDRLVAVADTLSLTSLTFTYDDADRLTGITRPNGVNTTYSYDAAGRTTRIRDGSILDIRYAYDAAGQVTEVDYVAAPIDPASAITNESTSFTYDAASQISTAGHQYDPRGRLTNAPGLFYRWDGASRLIAINNVNLGYNTLGDLVTRVESGNTNRYFYNYAIGLTPIMTERDDNTGQFTRCYIWSPGGVLLYLINLPDNTVNYPHFDRVGSTLALTGAAGSVTDGYAYDSYGRLLARTGTNTQSFRFNGRDGVRHETAGNLAHLRARYYDPRAARFLSPEPVWPELNNPKKLNRYQYALQDPLGFIDPEGTDEIAVETPVEEMGEVDLTIELFNREVARKENEQKFEHGPRHGKLTEQERQQVAESIKKYIKKLKRSSSKWLEELRKRVKDTRETDKRTEERERARREEESRRYNEDMERKYDAKRSGQQPGGSVIGPPVTPGGVTPTPFSPKQPAGEPVPPGGDVHGFLFGGGAANAATVSYTSETPYALPVSGKVQGLLDAGYQTDDVYSRPYFDGGISHRGKFLYLDLETGLPVFENDTQWAH